MRSHSASGCEARRCAIQTEAEKCEAIKSVLPLLHEHLDLIKRVKTTMERIVPDVSDGIYRPPDDPDKDEAWVRLEGGNRWRWRLDSVTDAWVGLGEDKPLYAMAVYYQHIELFPEWEPKRRYALAEEGVWRMATDRDYGIRGELALCHWTPIKPSIGRPRNREDRDQVIVSMALAGCTYREIIERAECSHSTVSDVLLAHGFRSRSTEYASGT
jgi:hypothetical protein